MAGTRMYVGIWLVLVAATLLEVAASMLQGEARLLVSLIVIIAAAKAVIIALYYQHLRYESIWVSALPLAALVALAGLAITAIISLGMGTGM